MQNRIGDFSIIPNPNKGTFTLLQSAASNQSEEEIIITDAVGKLIESKQVQFTGGKATLQLQLAAGMYWLRMNNNEQSQTLKLLIQ